MTHTTWRKSSYSAGSSACVELAVPPTAAVWVRDSKHPDGGHVEYAPAELAALIDAAASGGLDHLAG